VTVLSAFVMFFSPAKFPVYYVITII